VYRYSRLLFACAATLLAAMVSAAASGTTFVLIAPSDSGIYREFSESFRQSLRDLCRGRADLAVCAAEHSVLLRTIEDLGDLQDTDGAQLLIALGTEAAGYVMARSGGRALLFTLLPRSAYERLSGCCPTGNDAPVSAVFVEQPLERQFQLIAGMLPDARRVGVLLGPSSSMHADELHGIARAQGLEIRVASVTETAEVGPVLGQLLGAVEVMLAIPDPVVFNSVTISNILLATYRHEIPLIGYSEALVGAGATAAVFTRIGQLAESTAIAALEYCDRQTMPAPGFAPDFSVRVNRGVVRSLGLAVQSEESLEQSLRERGP
jgi:putative tryptophan/tyrosine transport system substrate-binding protein